MERYNGDNNDAIYRHRNTDWCAAAAAGADSFYDDTTSKQANRAGTVMELRHLRYFLAVARERNFSEAAKKLHIAQPPLSRQIKQLEEQLGVQLFDRHARPLALTEAGEFFQIQAQQLMAKLQEVTDATRRIGNGTYRWFGIGFVPSMLYGFLPEVIRRFRSANPDVEVILTELTTVQQLEALKTGRIDVGIGRLPISDSEVDCERVMDEALVAALPVQHPLLKRRSLTLDELAAQMLILYPAKPRPSFADHVLQLFHDRHIEVLATIDSNEMQTAIGLVAAGVGVTLVPASVQRLQREEIAYRPLKEKNATSPVTLHRRSGPATALQENFYRLVHQLTSGETNRDK